MKQRITGGALVTLILLVSYFALWPVPIEPVAWQPPIDEGYVGQFAQNDRLKIEPLEVLGHHGPEDFAVDARGRLYASTHEGKIIRLQADGSNPEVFANTNGRPLGIEMDAQGRLVVADAYRGLLSIDASGHPTVLTQVSEDGPILYADDLDISADGQRVYFSDASRKFSPKAHGGTFPASKLDVFEHGAHGRLLLYDRTSSTTKTLIDDLQFANGVALCPDEACIVLAETGMYRVLVYHLRGPKTGTYEVLIDNLPGFPDNVTRGDNGRFWVGLVSSRNPTVDRLAPHPGLRKAAQRLPKPLRPDAIRYGHVFAIGLNGTIYADLQDPSGSFARTTGALEHGPYLFVSSLAEASLGRMANPFTTR